MLLICMLLQLNSHCRIEAILENSSTKFEKLVLTQKQFQKAKQGEEEILFNGKIYDIKNATLNGNLIELVAYHDVREESLISLIEKFFDSENSGDDFSLHVLKLLVSVYTFSSQQFEFSQPFSSENFIQWHSGLYLSFTGETLTPPPDFIS